MSIYDQIKTKATEVYNIILREYPKFVILTRDYLKNALKKARENIFLVKLARITAITATIIIAFLLSVIMVLYLIPATMSKTHTQLPKPEVSVAEDNSQAYRKQIQVLSREVSRLRNRYAALTPGQSYMIINTTDNKFSLYRNRKLVREGFCSSGSYKMLQTLEGRSWIFRTPKGEFHIQGKTVNPTWKKPDWAFVEEGLPIPPPDHSSRFEYGVLGEYALALGDGYLIHGTLYKRFLGMPVTHGCVRLNDEDLEAVYNLLNIGSKVYIF